MRTRQTLTISLPPAMLKEVEKVSKVENRTQSELIREALRNYFYGRFPVATPTKSELSAIHRGRAEFKSGNYISLNELLAALETVHSKTGSKSSRKSSAKR